MYSTCALSNTLFIQGTLHEKFVFPSHPTHHHYHSHHHYHFTLLVSIDGVTIGSAQHNVVIHHHRGRVGQLHQAHHREIVDDGDVEVVGGAALPPRWLRGGGGRGRRGGAVPATTTTIGTTTIGTVGGTAGAVSSTTLERVRGGAGALRLTAITTSTIVTAINNLHRSRGSGQTVKRRCHTLFTTANTTTTIITICQEWRHEVFVTHKMRVLAVLLLLTQTPQCISDGVRTRAVCQVVQHHGGLGGELQAQVDGVVAHLQQGQDHDEQQSGGGEEQPRVLWCVAQRIEEGMR